MSITSIPAVFLNSLQSMINSWATHPKTLQWSLNMTYFHYKNILSNVAYISYTQINVGLQKFIVYTYIIFADTEFTWPKITTIIPTKY